MTEPAEDTPYLLFEVGGALYGVPLVAVREVVEPMAVRAVPNTVNAFKGVSNLRGQVISVMDLRDLLIVAPDVSRRQVLLVIELTTGLMAVAVDALRGVVPMAESQIERQPMLATSISQEHIRGIGRHGTGELVILIDLRAMIEAVTVATVNSSRQRPMVG